MDQKEWKITQNKILTAQCLKKLMHMSRNLLDELDEI